MCEQWWRWNTASTKCSYSKEVKTSSPSIMREQWRRWKNDEHEVLVLEVGQTSSSTKGQNFFTVDHARAMVVMESISTTCSYSQQVKPL
mmetsp:Transcript_82290/g.164499  ORF Transcript_82290/g.164499 Transcript_82290/m.164499 type:complete len:89 (+) Transcript_82290:235-501(+)